MLSEGKKDILGERVHKTVKYPVRQIITAKITTLQTLNVHVVLNSVMFPQILCNISKTSASVSSGFQTREN